MVKSYGACFIVLVMGCCLLRADDSPIAKVVKGKVEEINDALAKEDFAKVIDLTHAKAVELMGGRDKAIAVMQSGLKDMKSNGFSFGSVMVGVPSDPIKSASDLFVVVPYQQEMKAPGGRLLLKTFVIGVSDDQGKSWTFVNGDLDVKRIKQVLPDLPEQLKLPEREKPVFEKD